jgi:hypothetical protein
MVLMPVAGLVGGAAAVTGMAYRLTLVNPILGFWAPPMGSLRVQSDRRRWCVGRMVFSS